MTRFGWTIVAALFFVIGLIGGLVALIHSSRPVNHTTTQATTTPEVNPSTLSIYTSGQYGFAFFYPSNAVVSDAYSTTPLSGIPWRAGATTSGTPVVRIQDKKQEIRIGLSTDPHELKACMQPGPGENAEGTFTVGSTTWQKTMFKKIGTDDQEQVTSYRIVHDHACYAVELFQPLSGVASSTGYTVGDTITSFSFAD